MRALICHAVVVVAIAQTVTIVASASSAFLTPANTRRRLSLSTAAAKSNDKPSLPSVLKSRRQRSRFQSLHQLHAAADNDVDSNSTNKRRPTPKQPPFSLPTSLFLAGLAFDSYTEPPQTSSRWERGSSGVNVAFLSAAYTRSLYKGIIEVTPLRASDLPDEDDAAESMMTGGGVDAALLVSVVEGAWTEDVKKLEKESFHNGVLDLAGCAHVGRSSTAWGNVDEKKAKRNKAKGGRRCGRTIRRFTCMSKIRKRRGWCSRCSTRMSWAEENR